MGRHWRSVCARLYSTAPGRDGDGSTSGSPRAEARAWGDTLVSSPPFIYMFPNKQWKKKKKLKRETHSTKTNGSRLFPRQLKQCVRKGRDGFTLPKETLLMSRVFLFPSSGSFTMGLFLNNTLISFFFFMKKNRTKNKSRQITKSKLLLPSIQTWCFCQHWHKFQLVLAFRPWPFPYV